LKRKNQTEIWSKLDLATGGLESPSAAHGPHWLGLCFDHFGTPMMALHQLSLIRVNTHKLHSTALAPECQKMPHTDTASNAYNKCPIYRKS